MKIWGLLIGGAVSPYLFDTVLTMQVALVLLLSTALLALLLPAIRIYCLLPVMFLLTSLAINERLEQRLPLSLNRTLVSIDGRVASLPLITPQMTSFVFTPLDPVSEYPERIRVSWYAERNATGAHGNTVPEMHAGQHWRLNLELRSTKSRVNFHGMDSERWYFAEGIAALGFVQGEGNLRMDTAAVFDIPATRERLLSRLQEVSGGAEGFRILAALAVADRRGLTKRDRKVLSATGTGHLLAISGLHIGLAAAMGFYAGRFCLLFLGVGLRQAIAVILPWMSAWVAALSYSVLAGFGVSTQRALVMLSVAALVSVSRRNVHPLLGWLLAMALVLLLDPFAPLRAGFWFSFIAVLVLMIMFVPRFGQMPLWKRALIAQLGISLVMAPLGMYWFQQASLPGLLANLVAIPFVSLLIVPLILTGLIFVYLPLPLAGWALTTASQCCLWLFEFLELLSRLQPDRFNSSLTPAFGAVLLAMVGGAMVMLPRGTPGRLAGVVLMLPFLWPHNVRPGNGEVRLNFLDVGQGMAVLLSTSNYQLIYDTGPGNGLVGEEGWDMVQTSILPAIRASGQGPDLIIASHADLDHAGGLMTLQSVFPSVPVMASLPVEREGVQACQSPGSWRADSLSFEVLHPSAGLPYLGNDSSCVISARGRQFSVLLSGDISHVVEKRLVANRIGKVDVMTVPHHGSSSSSSAELLSALRSDWGLISAGINNRFDFPRQDVLDRYARSGINTLNTADCGGIRLTALASGEVQLESARTGHKTLWRWPAADGCP